MYRRKVVVSFDYENDRSYYYLLKAWDANKDFEFFFADLTPEEIQTESVAVVKQVLSRTIGQADCMIALIGAHSNDRHRDSCAIGYTNWQAYEIAKNYERGNGLIVVRIDADYEVPDEAYGIGAEWATFSQLSVVTALSRV